jgi:hypothetical protein
MSRGTTPFLLAETLILPQTQYQPFSWANNANWRSISAHVVPSQQLALWKPPSERDLNAMFYRVQHAMTTLSLVDQNTLLPTYLMTTVLNSMRSSGYPNFDRFYALMKPIAASVISGLSRALPEPILDVLREKTFAAALQACDVDTVTFMLVRLNADPFEPMRMFSFIDSPIRHSLIRGSHELAKVLMTHMCRLGNMQKMGAALEIICRTPPPIVFQSGKVSNSVELACIALSAGASPTEGCIKFARSDLQYMKRLLETSKDNISSWLRMGLLTLGSGIEKRKLCDEDTLSYVLRECQHQLSISDPDTKTALLVALHYSTIEKRSWATETILRTLGELGFQFIPNSNNDEDIRTSFEAAYREDKWDIATSLIATQIPTTGEEARETKPRSVNRVRPGDVKAMLMNAIDQEDTTRVIHLYSSPAFASVLLDRSEVFKIVAACGSDIMAIALLRHAHAEKSLTYSSVRNFVACGRVKVMSSFLSAIPEFKIALSAARERKDFDPLDNLLHVYFSILHIPSRTDGLYASMDHQIKLRSLAYHAVGTNEKTLFMWLLECDLSLEELVIFPGQRFDLEFDDSVIPSLLAIAAARNDTWWLRFLFEHGAEGRDSMALLYAVVHNANDATIRMLLEMARSQPRCGRRIYGSAALRFAVRHRDAHMIDMLWDVVDVDGIELSSQDRIEKSRCVSPLGKAILMEDLEMVSILLHKGANPNALVAYDSLEENPWRSDDPIKRVSPLLTAIYVGSLPIVETLIRAGAMIDYKQRLGVLRTPLQWAAEKGMFDIVQYLIKQGAIIDTVPAIHGGTAMQLAAANGYVGIATLLLEHGANPNYPPPPGDGRTAFELAAEWSRIDMMLLLMRWGVRLDLKFGNPPETQYERAQRLAAKNGYPASKRFVQYLYGIASHGGRAQDRDTSSSPLHGTSPSTPTASPGGLSADDARTLGLCPMNDVFPSSLMDFFQ